MTDAEMEWMLEVGKFNQASLAMHQHAARVRDALIDQMSELVETVAQQTGNVDLMAGWAARLIVASEGDGDGPAR